MSKSYVDFMVEETKKILAIDSPSGYTGEVADYVMGECTGRKRQDKCRYARGAY